MFDIISWIREKIFRRPTLSRVIAWEELSEKQTTKLGYFLLVCMFFAIMSTAQWTISIIQDIPERPTPIPSCVTNIISIFDTSNPNYTTYDYDYTYQQGYAGYNNCDLISMNPEYDLTTEYDALKAPYEILNTKSQEIARLESEKSNAQYRQNSNQQDYNVSLRERTAWEDNPLYKSQQIRTDIVNTRESIASLESQIQTLKDDISTIRLQNAQLVSSLKDKTDSATFAYNRAQIMYRMKIALLSLFFAGAVFIVLYRLYVRRKIENSPHTIIFSVATFAYGIILLEILLMFLWDVIPHEFLNWLLGIISFFTPLLYLVQFLWPVLIVAVFGFLVYRIQKRLYSPQNMLKRFVTDKKCPGCGNAVDMTRPFCPLCSHEIHMHCPHCHELTMKGMPYCSNCGVGLPEEHDVIKSNNMIQVPNDGVSSAGYSWVVFTLNDGASFVSRRETIIQLALHIEKKLAKNTFAAGEFVPLMENILAQIEKKWISQTELSRITGKIDTWAKVGWSFELQK